MLLCDPLDKGELLSCGDSTQAFYTHLSIIFIASLIMIVL